jgi:hypothetical protein
VQLIERGHLCGHPSGILADTHPGTSVVELWAQAAAAASTGASASDQPRAKKQRTQEATPTVAASAPSSGKAAAAADSSDDDEPVEAAEEVAAVAPDESSDSDSTAGSCSGSDDDSDDSSSDAASSAPASSALQTRVLHFRTYTPHDPTLRVEKKLAASAGLDMERDNAWMDAELQSVIEEALTNNDDDKVLLSITPKPLNWDLRRDLAPKMKVLQARTTEKIREIIGKEVEKQKQMEESSSSSSSDSDSSSEEEDAKQ